MSNYLAIATVTATLQRLLQAVVQIDLPAAKVTTVLPEASGGKTPEVGVNIYIKRFPIRLDRTQIRIGNVKATPQQVSEKEIRFDRASLPLEEIQGLRAGVQSLQVLHPIQKRWVRSCDESEECATTYPSERAHFWASQ